MEKGDKNKNNKPSFFERISLFISKAIHFATYDIWRITESEVSGMKELGISATKTTILAIRSFTNENLQSRASALTYSTLLAIIPMLAVLLGIAHGFGAQDLVRNSLGDYIPGHNNESNKVFEFVDRYLTQAQGEVIMGIGLIILFYTVVSLISNIEDTFNDIWQIKKSRSLPRKVTDYLALFLILPILMTVSSGISIFMSSIQNTVLDQFVFLTPLIDIILKVAPFVIGALVFTGLYIFLPNTKVKFIPGVIAGVIAGCAFQFLQFIYISGQIWVTKYNAIYGSFAAIPLLLLWLQLSWLICLFGAALAYAAQNVSKFSFEKDSKNISRRYKDFIFVVIASLIIKRFEKGEKPYTADELSSIYHIPIRLTIDVVYTLTELHILTEVIDNADEWVIYYQPAVDINQITVSCLLTQIDQHGSENFKIDRKKKFIYEWETILKVRKDMFHTMGNVLLKDL